MKNATLERLAFLSKNLNEASDLLSKQIGEAEAALNALRLGVWAWVDVYHFQDEPEGPSGRVRLGYGKREGKWGLLLCREYSDFPDNLEVSFLSDSPRLEKLAAVEKLPDLLTELEQQAVQIADEARKKATSVKDITAALKKVTQP